MRHQAQLLSPPLQALYRVFVQPSLLSSRPRANTTAAVARSLCTASTASTTTTRRTVNWSQLPGGASAAPRSSQSSPTTHAFHTTARNNAASRPPEQRTQLWDAEIQARQVIVVDPATNKLLAPQPLRRVLQSLDQRTHRLVCVTPAPTDGAYNRVGQPVDEDGRVDGRRDEWIPTCRVLSKKDMYEADKARAKAKTVAKKNGTDTGKKIELNWAIDANDLGHRLKRLDEFLRDGKKVEVVLAKKKRSRKASPDECQGVVDRILATVKGIEGAKVGKPMEGKIGMVATLFFEGVKEDAGKKGKGNAVKMVEES